VKKILDDLDVQFPMKKGAHQRMLGSVGAALHFPSIPSFLVRDYAPAEFWSPGFPAAGDEERNDCPSVHDIPSGYLKIAIENCHL